MLVLQATGRGSVLGASVNSVFAGHNFHHVFSDVLHGKPLADLKFLIPRLSLCLSCRVGPAECAQLDCTCVLW